MSLLLTFGYTAHAACEYDIPGDFNGDCVVDYKDLVIIAIDWLESADSHEWSVRYDGPQSNTDQPKSIAVDGSDVYVTGASYSNDTNYDYTTIKYSPDNKQPVWVAVYDGPGSGKDEPYDIVVDGNSSIYVAGQSTGDGTSSDYAVVKYHQDSNIPVWVARYDGPAHSNDIAYAAAIDSKGNIYVTGHSVGIGDNVDCLTIKYSPDSNQPVWVAIYNGQADGNDIAYDAAVDSVGNIYVTGRTDSGPPSGHDYATVKYSTDSNKPVWVAAYSGQDYSDDTGWDIEIDDNDNIYVTGDSFASETSADYVTIKYGSEANEPLWIAHYTTVVEIGFDTYQGRAMVIDNNNKIYVTVSDASSGTLNDFVTLRYSPSLACTANLDGDLDDNCRIDFADYAVLAGNWLEDSTSTEPPPEPDPNEPGGPGRTPYVSTRKPHVSTIKPHISERKPHVSTIKPHVSTRKPNAFDPNEL